MGFVWYNIYFHTSSATGCPVGNTDVKSDVSKHSILSLARNLRVRTNIEAAWSAVGEVTGAEVRIFAPRDTTPARAGAASVVGGDAKGSRADPADEITTAIAVSFVICGALDPLDGAKVQGFGS